MDAEKRKAAGHLGGSTTMARHGREHFVRIGRRGGDTVAEKYEGTDYYQEIGRKGGQKVRRMIAQAKALEADE